MGQNDRNSGVQVRNHGSDALSQMERPKPFRDTGAITDKEFQEERTTGSHLTRTTESQGIFMTATKSWGFVFTFSLLFTFADANAVERVALVIGNSSYTELGTLSNTKNDALDIERELASLGFSTKLVLDANEQTLRREFRLFSARSEGASVALVFYAGHGAQIAGENYLLPVDLDIPNREADIQLSAVKVDDLLSSIKSSVKIVFLDACRDNPVLFKSLSKGRGASYSRGLAPPRENQSGGDGTGGGIFIGYATDSGSIAADGVEKHSPFTEALLRHIKKPVSIDDMFSMVTRDVRQATANKQRPYKYASMETIVCLSPSCDTERRAADSRPSMADRPVAQGERELQLALASNDIEKVREISSKYSDTSAGRSARKAAEDLRRQFTNDWVAIDATNVGLYFYYQPSTVRHGNGRTWATIKQAAKGIAGAADPSLPPFGESPEYGPVLTAIVTEVVECKARKAGLANSEEFNDQGVSVKKYVIGDPRIIDLPLDYVAGSIVDTFAGMVCPPKNAGRIVSDDDLKKSDLWKIVSTFADGTAENFVLQGSLTVNGNEVTAITMTKYAKPSVTPMYQWSKNVKREVVRCDTMEFAYSDADFLDKSDKLVSKLYAKNVLNWEVANKGSPAEITIRTLCLSAQN
jgi:hypothetical protein